MAYVIAFAQFVSKLKVYDTVSWGLRGQGTSLCMTPRGPVDSCTVRYPGPGSHADTWPLYRLDVWPIALSCYMNYIYIDKLFM